MCRKPQGPCTPRKPLAKSFCSFPPCGEMPMCPIYRNQQMVLQYIKYLFPWTGKTWDRCTRGCLWPPPTPEANRSPCSPGPAALCNCKCRQCSSVSRPGGRTSHSLLFPNMRSSFWWGGVFRIDLSSRSSEMGRPWGCWGRSGEGKMHASPQGWLVRGVGNGKAAIIPWHFSQLGLPHCEGFAWQRRSQFGGHPSERAAMAHSLLSAFGGAGFMPTVWSRGAWRIGKGLFFLRNFKNTSKNPRNNGEFVPSTAALLPAQPRAPEPSGASPHRAVRATKLLPPPRASSLCGENTE